MPPCAIFSSDVVMTLSSCGLPVSGPHSRSGSPAGAFFACWGGSAAFAREWAVAQRCINRSMPLGCGNLGAEPKPPCSASNSFTADSTMLSIISGLSDPDLLAKPSAWLMAPITLSARQKRSEEHTSELQSHSDLVCRLLLEKKKKHVSRGVQHQA